ncbi:MAG: hypothetical protein ACXWW0_01575 [Bacteroidia bacterium]
MKKVKYAWAFNLFVKLFLLYVAIHTISEDAGIFDFLNISFDEISKYRLAIITAIIVTFFRLREIHKQNKNASKSV